MKKPKALRCPEHISWIVDCGGLLLLDFTGNRTKILSCSEGAVWDLLTRNRPEKLRIFMISVILGMEMDDAAAFLSDCLESWLRDGWLIPCEGA
ncbi:MAG: hypothetical protein P4L42_15020 [Desulfocapsaceae bacterium]|nr:hypothetical protein [Desulfocapsaceae bacterium]